MKRLLTLAIILMLIISNTGIAYAEPPSLDAGAYILIDAQTGDVLCEKNSSESLYPASTTKIMTAILALENGDPEEVLTASQSAIDAIGYNGSNIGIIPGEKIPMKSLIQAMMISSANEASNIIAEHIGGSIEGFAEMMNNKAIDLGAVDTHFVNASGIHDEMHYTTAADIALIARYAMTIPEFREIVSTKSFTMPPTNKHAKWPVLSNSNKLMLTNESDLYEINGIKTGFTGPAGNNLVSSAINDEGMELIAAVMCVKNENAAENVRIYSKELLDYGFNSFKRVELVEKGKVYRNVKVEDAADIYGLDLITSDSLVRVLPKEESRRDIREVSHLSEKIYAPVNKGDIMGYVEFFRGDSSIGSVDLIAARSIEYKPEPVTLVTLTENPQTIIDKIIGNFYFKIGVCIAGLIIVFILLRVVLKTISRSINSRRYS